MNRWLDKAAVGGLAAIAALTAVPGCELEPAAVACDESRPVAAMQYNVFGGETLVRDPAKGARIAAQIAAQAPDFVGAQECAECASLAAQLPPRYRLAASPRAGVAIIFDSDRWRLEETGELVLGIDDDGFGERVARWARFVGADSGECIYVYSTHWCVPVRSPDDSCSTERQLRYARALLADIGARRSPQSPVIVAGDLNVFDGFDRGPVIARLISAGLADVVRDFDPAEAVSTFSGSSLAPPGRIDYLLATNPVDTVDAFTDLETIAPGDGSDHFAVVATVEFAE